MLRISKSNKWCGIIASQRFLETSRLLISVPLFELFQGRRKRLEDSEGYTHSKSPTPLSHTHCLSLSA